MPPQCTGDLAKDQALLPTWFALVTHTRIPRKRLPVEDYLQGQGRYRHLFKPTPQQKAIATIQAQGGRYWAVAA